MNGAFRHQRPKGQGRGMPTLEFWEDRPGRVPGPREVKRDQVSNNYKLHVRSIPPDWDMIIFENVFKKCGRPVNMYLHPCKVPNSFTWGFVEYEDYQEAYTAVRELNNNVVLNIQVSFAKDKSSCDGESIDPILKYLQSQVEEDSEEENENNLSIDHLVDPRTLTKTVKNEAPIGTTIQFEGYTLPVLDADVLRKIEENLFQSVLDNVYKQGECPLAKCNMCGASCSSACSGCYDVYYCSENCLDRDWPSHRRTCKGASLTPTGSSGNSGGGDFRQSNGFSAYEPDRENRSDSRNNRFADNREASSWGNRDSFKRGDQRGNDQRKRSVLEERRERLGTANRQNGRGTGAQSFGQNNQRPQSDQGGRSSFGSRGNTSPSNRGWGPQTVGKKESEEWGPKRPDNDVKDSSAVSPGHEFLNKEKAFLQVFKVKEEPKTPDSSEKEKEMVLKVPPKPSEDIVKVIIFHCEDYGLFWVQKVADHDKVRELMSKLQVYCATNNSQFEPVLDGICCIQYKELNTDVSWFRCQVKSLKPLTVLYIDYGYPEEVKPDRLFELSEDLKSTPPFAFRIKLVAGTPAMFYDKAESDSLDVKLIEKVGSSWLVQVQDSTSASAAHPKVPEANAELPATIAPAITSAPVPSVETPTRAPAVTSVSAQSSNGVTPSKPFPSMYDVSKFNTVTITYPGKESDTYFVGPETIWNTCAEMCKHFASASEHCEVLAPELGARGITLYMDSWYRVEIVSVTPEVRAYYIDYGNVEPVTNLKLFKRCPETHKDIPNLVHKIKLAPGTSEKYYKLPEESLLSVKPVSWFSDDTVLVEVEGEIYPEKKVNEDIAVAVTAPPPTPQPTPQLPPQPTPQLPPQPTPQLTPQPTPQLTPQLTTQPTPQLTPQPTPQPTPQLTPQPKPQPTFQPSGCNAVTPTPAATPVSVQASKGVTLSKPFPSIFDASKFNTATITYPGKESDTYFVGPETIWNTLAEMCKHLASASEHCEVLAPELGARGISLYMDSWYRVEIVSVTPEVRAYYIDFGNVEPITNLQLFKRCPETHKDIPNLVHKIKLAPGTNEKYFKLPDESLLSVKPVSWFSDDTVLVEVEGETYPEKKVNEDSALAVTAPPPSPCPATEPAPQLTPQPTQQLTPQPIPQLTSQPTLQPAPQPSSPAPPISTDTENHSLVSNLYKGVVDLLEETWKIAFLPRKVDFMKNSLFGQVYTEQIPSAFSFIAENESFQNTLSLVKFDPDFRPREGEIVGLKLPDGEWARGKVLPQEGLVALIDDGWVIRCSQLVKLPESYSSIPPMAAMLTLSKDDPLVLSRLVEADDIIFDVVKVSRSPRNGRAVVSVSGSSTELDGELRSWYYEPLESPDPLPAGESVTISRVVDSNTLMVIPANDREQELEQMIQIECEKATEKFKNPPQEGDYVCFTCMLEGSYYRCRVDKAEGDNFVLYAVDGATLHEAKIDKLKPLPKSLRNVPCRISEIQLKDVDKTDMTEEAQAYLQYIVDKDKSLTIDLYSSGKATLTVKGEKDTLNNKLKSLLELKVLPTKEGKYTIMKLPTLAITLDKELDLVVAQTDPLYMQTVTHYLKYLSELHPLIQTHCASDNNAYNPCQSELCLASFEGEWYRCQCLRETNVGVSSLMLLDYGNIFSTETSNIRRITPEMLTMPSIALPCTIHGLPDPVPPALKTRLDEMLQPDMKITGKIVGEKDGRYEIFVASLQKLIEEFK